MVDYCAVEYINTTLKMKIRMVPQRTKTVKGPRKGQGKKKKTKKCVATFHEKQQQLFFLEKKI